MGPAMRWIFLLSTFVIVTAQKQQNPTILEDARVHPTSDGSFGFLYRTQDGIAHAAKGDPGGAVHGRFSYTDPTGLKVNFNYNAGAQAVAQKQQEQQFKAPVAAAQNQPRYTQAQVQPQYEPQAQQQSYQPAPQANYYNQPQAQYRRAQQNELSNNYYNN